MLKKIARFFMQSFVVFLIVCVAACTTTKRNQADQVEKLQNSTEYSAVESEWNELYQ